jgi:MipA family protein
MTLLSPSQFAAAMLGLSCAAAQAQFQPRSGDGPLSVTLGLGVGAGPEYQGGKKMIASPLPIFSASYKTDSIGSFELGPGGLRWSVLQSPLVQAGLVVGVDGGRNETTKGLGKKRTIERLRGMGQIKSSAEVGVFGGVTVADAFVGASIAKGSSRGHDGIHGDLELSVPLVKSGVQISLVSNARFGNTRYNQAYFGVTPLQSSRSGLVAYSAKSGFTSVGVGLGAQYSIDKHWAVQSMLGVDRLIGAAAKSPIALRRLQPTFMAGVAYTF